VSFDPTLAPADALGRHGFDEPEASAAALARIGAWPPAAALGGEQLGVGQPLDRAVPGQDHGGGDQRPGERAAAGLVHPGDPAEAGVPEAVLEERGGGGEHDAESIAGWDLSGRGAASPCE
jgi:hypothetical protein